MKQGFADFKAVVEKRLCKKPSGCSIRIITLENIKKQKLVFKPEKCSCVSKNNKDIKIHCLSLLQVNINR